MAMLINPYVFAAIAGGLPPDFTSSTISSLTGGSFSAAHGLGGTPDFVIAEMVCLVANNGYSVGDSIVWHSAHRDGSGGIATGDDIIGMSATDCFIVFSSNRLDMVVKGGSGNFSLFQNNDWGVRFKAWNTLPPDFDSGDMTLPADGALNSAAHGLGAALLHIVGEYTCVIAEDGYAVGDVMQFQGNIITNAGNNNPTTRGHNLGYDATNIIYIRGSTNYLIKNTGARGGAPTEANWEFRLKAWEFMVPGFTSALIPAVQASTHVAAHGLSTVDFILAELVCNTADNGWSPGDRIPYTPANHDTSFGPSNQFRGSGGGYDAVNAFMPTSSNAQILFNKAVPNVNSLQEFNYSNWDVEFNVWGS